MRLKRNQEREAEVALSSTIQQLESRMSRSQNKRSMLLSRTLSKLTLKNREKSRKF